MPSEPPSKPSLSEAPLSNLSSVALNFRDVVLGVWSSHPHWLEAGSRRLRVIVVALLWVVYGIAFYAWLRGHSLGGAVVAVVTSVFSLPGKFALALTAFSFGMLVAASFQLRWAMKKYSDDSFERGSDAPVGLNVPAVLAVVGIGLVLPLLLTFLPGLAIELRFLGPLLAFLPVCFLSYLLHGTNDRRRFPWISAAVLMPLFWAIAAIGSLLAWIAEQAPAWVGTFFPVLKGLDGWKQAFTTLAIGVTVFATLQVVLWWRARSIPELQKENAEVREDVADDATKDTAVKPDKWLKELAKDAGITELDIRELTPNASETVDLAQSSPYAIFFGNQPPTLDQHKILEDFVHLADKCLTGVDGSAPQTAVEMVIEGPAGSGRTSTIDALAMLSAVARGTRAVIMVPDEGRIGFAVARIRNKLAALNLGEFLVVDRLEFALSEKIAGRAPAEICVTTPEIWERLLAGSLVREGDTYKSVRNLMLGYSVVLVDDWMEHPVEPRIHLPFIVDKHRVLLESEMLPSIRVYAFPRLGETGRNLVLDRLIGHGGIVDGQRQFARLRYRPNLKATVADFEVEAVDDVIQDLAEAISSRQISSILLRKNIDYLEAQRQTEELRTKFQHSAITVCYCHDQISSLTGTVSAVLMKASYGPDAVFALRAGRQEDEIYILRVRGRRERPVAEFITPLIVDRTARGLAEIHLLNALRFVKERAPVPQRSWGQLGLLNFRREEVKPGGGIGKLLLDRPEDMSDELRRNRPYLGKLGAFIALDAPFRRQVTVDCTWIHDPGEPFFLSGGTETYGPEALNLTDPVDTAVSGNTTVLWRGNDGAELGRSQLQFMDRMLLRRKQTFSAESIKNARPAGIQIDATRFRENGRDPVNPKLEISWKCSLSAVAAAERLSMGLGGPEHGFHWVPFDSQNGHLIATRLIELADDDDRPTPCGSVPFEYRASLRLLLLSPKKEMLDEPEEMKAALSNMLGSDAEWGTGHADFAPGLTYALACALETDLPTSGYFGKALVFRAVGQLARFAEAVVWFVEPLGSGRTLSNAVQELLLEKDRMRTIVKNMDDVLRTGWDKSSKSTLAQFWLARRQRKAILHYERVLVANLLARLPAPSGELKSSDYPELLEEYVVGCPHCGKEQRLRFSSSDHGRWVQCCNKYIANLVRTAGGKFISPELLVEPWWPTELRVPGGTAVQKIQEVWRAVASRMEYTLDYNQGERAEDLWLPPQESWERRYGDCEDHSILVVAMLRKLELRAWLTLGHFSGGYHAWVEVEVDGVTFLLEATAKEPLPEILPDARNVDDVNLIYRGRYDVESLAPARTDGNIYQFYRDGNWEDISLVVAQARPLAMPDTPAV